MKVNRIISRKKMQSVFFVGFIFLLLSNVGSVFGALSDVSLPNDTVAYPIIENGDFETSSLPWSPNSGTTLSITTSADRTGSKGLYVRGQANSYQQSVLTYDFTDRLNEIKGRNYQATFQGYFKSPDDSVKFKLEYYYEYCERFGSIRICNNQWTGVTSQWEKSNNDWISPQVSTYIPGYALAIRVQVIISDLVGYFLVSSYLDDLLITYGPTIHDKERLYIYENGEFTQESYGLSQQSIEILSVEIPFPGSTKYDVLFRVNTLVEINSEHDNVNFKGKHGVYRMAQNGHVLTGYGSLNTIEHGIVVLDDTSTFIVDESTNPSSSRGSGLIGGIMRAASWANFIGSRIGYGNPYTSGALLLINSVRYYGSLQNDAATSIAHSFASDLEQESDFFKNLVSSTVYRYTYSPGTNNEVCINTSHVVGWWDSTYGYPDADNIYYITSTCLTLD